MQVLFVHPNFPGQFWHIANYLTQKIGWECIFVTARPEVLTMPPGPVKTLFYRPEGGASEATHVCSRTFENAVWSCDAIYKAVKANKNIQPDLIVGHSGFGTTLFLRELFPRTPVVHLAELYYHPHGPRSVFDFRADLRWQTRPEEYQRARCFNAMVLLNLQNCELAYCPTRFQHSLFPQEYSAKMRVIFDGIDRYLFHGHGERLRPPGMPRKIAGVEIGQNTRVVSYVSRGLESMRGFDIFMRAAKRIAKEYPDVHFFVVGSDHVSYGNDLDHVEGKRSFREWVLSKDQYDLSKFTFTGILPHLDLARLLASTDLHIYLTVPFVLSWSMMDAMSCGAVVLGSATSPVQEIIRDGKNGLLANFFDPEDFATKALAVLRDPAKFRPLGRKAEEMVVSRYSLEAVMPEMMKMYKDAQSSILSQGS